MMQDVYKKALKEARLRVFDNPKYENIISFCKYKIDKNIYTRQENVLMNKKRHEIKTDVKIIERKSNNFKDFLKNQNKRIINEIILEE